MFIQQEGRVISIEEGIEKLIAAYAPELFLPAADKLREGLEFRRYRGKKQDILLYMPRPVSDNPGIDNVVASLDVLKERASAHYAFIEHHVRLVCPSDSDHNYTPRIRPVVKLLSETTKRKARCCVALVHEATEISLLNSGLDRSAQHKACFINEADCLELLGQQYWDEIGLWWLGKPDKETYIAMRVGIDDDLKRVEP